MTVHALLIACWTFPNYATLEEVPENCAKVARLLSEVYGAHEENIIRLENCSVEEMALANKAVRRKCASGDTYFVYGSSHGDYQNRHPKSSVTFLFLDV